MRDDHDASAVDRTIDAAARAMTRGEPLPALRARVRARLEARPARGLAWEPMLAVGIAGIVLILIVPGVMRVELPQPASPVLVAATGPALPVPSVPARTVVEPRAPVERLARIARPDQSAPIVIAPLDPPAPIAVDTSSGMVPIEITPLAIEPLPVAE